MMLRTTCAMEQDDLNKQTHAAEADAARILIDGVDGKMNSGQANSTCPFFFCRKCFDFHSECKMTAPVTDSHSTAVFIRLGT
jgi:hypothetical protein